MKNKCNLGNNFNASITGEVNQTFFPSLSGYYAVEVTIGDCSSTSECRLVDFTGIDEIESIISVHPNPTKDEVTLSIGTALLETEFVVTDNAGRIILTDTFKSTKQKVNLSGFDNGVYFIRTDKESPVKIIKQ
ncbi:T9SS type A sorting domain-containing protein [Crocinitomicaceae bacterium]|nr:T9SS type A sorting domain-containing protein [Crocinitomicaceae bacterium]